MLLESSGSAFMHSMYVRVLTVSGSAMLITAARAGRKASNVISRKCLFAVLIARMIFTARAAAAQAVLCDELRDLREYWNRKPR